MLVDVSNIDKNYGDILKLNPNYTEKNFRTEYRKHLYAASVTVECAKVYCVENWTKVSDWTGLEIDIIDNTKKITKYYSFKGGFDPVPMGEELTGFRKIWWEIEEQERAGHNPVKSVSDVVLDTSDGDFSININGNPHLWINKEAIVVLADYIEKNIK